MKGKVRPHRLYKKKSGKLYIKKGNKKVVIHTSPSLSLKKILAYVQKNIKSERIQPKKHVKAQETSKPLAALPLSQAPPGKQDFAASILNNKMVDTPLSAVASLSNAVNNIKAPVKDSLYSDHVKAEELKVAKEEAKQAEGRRNIATTDMDRYIKLASIMLSHKIATDASKNPATAADAEADSMMNAQQDQAIKPQPVGEQKDGEIVQDEQSLANMTEAASQAQIAEDARQQVENDGMYIPQRGRLPGRKVEPQSMAGIDDLLWFVDKTFLDPDNVIQDDGKGAAEKKK